MEFSSNDCILNVKQFGANGDGKTLDTPSIQTAIDNCDLNGGGTVVIPPGNYLCGTIHLCSNLELRIMMGATIIASKDESLFDKPEKIKFPDAQGDECAIFHYALLSGDEIENVRILGGGTLDDERHHRHGPKPIALKNCEQITIRDIISYNSSSYAISLGNCELILIENVRIFSSNADGIDLDCCRNAQIINCHIESRDDAVVLKGSLSYDKLCPTSNIIITNCDLATSCVGFKIGSETNGDFNNIVFSNNVIHPLGIARSPLAGIAIESVDGANISALNISNISMKGMKSPLLIRLGKRMRGNMPDKLGSINDILIGNITAIKSHFPMIIAGIPEKKLDRISLTNFHLEFDYSVLIDNTIKEKDQNSESRPPGTSDLHAIPENETKYPDIRMFGDPLPVWGIFLRHASRIHFSNVECYLQNENKNPPQLFLDTSEIECNGLHFHSI